MASEYTPNYQLNQWSLDDSLIMEEFNEDNRKLETALTELQAAIPRLYLGEYTGTGTYGEANPNILTFDFRPMMVIMCGSNTSGGAETAIAVNGSTYCSALVSDSSQTGLHLRWGEQSLSWFSVYSQGYQFNIKDRVYRYLVIG